MIKRGASRRGVWTFVVGTVGCLLVAGALRVAPPGTLAQVARVDPEAESDVFTPAHRSFGEAIRHFFGIEPDPVQPIAFSHRVHVDDVDLECTFCHDGVTIGPVAGIPSVSTCMLCHTEVARGQEPVESLVSFWERGQEPAWQRVYGWVEEDHVRFNHRPHTLNGVGCETCHGDVASMTVAEPAVEHTMGFCMSCHETTGASTECVACHY
jgi:hypothetical protein